MLKYFKQVRSLAKDSKYRKIFFSRIFDPDFYLNRYPDVAREGSDPLHHYCTSGWKERRRPSVLFDTLFYLRTYFDEEEELDPLAHFIDEGWLAGNNPNPFFDTNYYLKQCGDDLHGGVNPLTHYLKKGWRKGLLPAPFFAVEENKRLLEGRGSRDGDPLTAFLKEYRDNPPAYFDSQWYGDQNPGLSRNEIELWHHYVDYGVHDGKSPVPVFDAKYYRSVVGDEISTGIEPFAHYRDNEHTEKHAPSPWFDPEFYRVSCSVGDEWAGSMLEHYLECGVHDKAYTDQRVADLAEKPVISIVVPVYNPKPHYLNNCIRSVLYQAYPHWELCLCDDCSTEPHVADMLAEWSGRDGRIKVIHREENGGISAATNSAAALAEGDYLGFLDNDDELTVDCLYHIVHAINATGAELLYTDEDLIGEDGTTFSTFLKAGYNRELLLCHNYITHFVVTRRDLFQRVGGCDSAHDGAQDFDMVLKLSEIASTVVHVPEIAYHWRASETSTSINHGEKEYADDAGANAVRNALLRSGIQGKVEPTEWKFYYRPVREITVTLPATIIVYLESFSDSTRRNIAILLKETDYPNIDFVFVTTLDEEDVRQWLAANAKQTNRVSIVSGQEGTPRAVLLNTAAKGAEGDYLVFVSGDIQLLKSDWLQALVEYGQGGEVGLVGGRVNLPEQFKDLHQVPDISNESPSYFRQFLTDCSVHMNGLQWAQEVMAVPMELFLVRAEVFSAAGGFREQLFPDLMGALDLSYRLRVEGYLNIYTPFCAGEWLADGLTSLEEHHLEALRAEKEQFQQYWKRSLIDGNPYYNPGCYRERGIMDNDFINWCAGGDL